VKDHSNFLTLREKIRMKVIKALNKFLPERGAGKDASPAVICPGMAVDGVSVGCLRGLEREVEGFGKHETIPVSQGF
jgi:hypothetical protein